jgi:hypothetical protein
MTGKASFNCRKLLLWYSIDATSRIGCATCTALHKAGKQGAVLEAQHGIRAAAEKRQFSPALI